MDNKEKTIESTPLSDHHILHGIHTNVEVIKVEMANLRMFILKQSEEIGKLRETVQHLDKHAVLRDEHKENLEKYLSSLNAVDNKHDKKSDEMQKTVLKLIIIVTLLSASIGSAAGLGAKSFAEHAAKNATTTVNRIK